MFDVFPKEVHILTRKEASLLLQNTIYRASAERFSKSNGFPKNLPEPSNFTSRWWSNFTSIIYPISKSLLFLPQAFFHPMAPSGAPHPHPWTPPPEVLPVHEVQDIYTWHTLRRWFQEHRGDRCAWQSPCGSPPASCAGKWPWLLHSKHKKLRTCQVFRKISTFTLHVSYKSVCLCGDCCVCWHFCLLYPAPEVAQSTLLQCKEKHWGPNEMTLPSNPGTVAPYQAVHICCAGA